jgi:hypothetical protein
MRRLSVAQNVNNVLTDIARKMGGGRVQVGFLEGATYPDGTPVAAVAAWDEFGHGGNFPSPPRPFFRNMIAKESPGWPAKMANLAKATNYDGKLVLQLMGEDIAGALKQSIIETNDPPLSATTLILRKRFWTNPGDITMSDVVSAQQAAANGENGASGTQAKPLVWSGHLLASVGYEVKR